MSYKIENWSVRTKLRLIAGLGILGLLILSVWQWTTSYLHGYESQKVSVRAQVESAMGVLEWAHGLEKSAKLDREQAQLQAKAALAVLRYGGDNYFWLNDLQSRVIMHPIKPELDGKDGRDIKDANGKPLFVAFVEVAKNSGQGYVNYHWPKPGSDHPVEKVSFVQVFAPWGWVLGSGMYVEDVKAAYWRENQSIIVGMVLIALCMVGLSQWIGSSIVMRLNQVKQMARALAQGHLDCRIAVAGSDDVGQLMGALNDTAQQLRQMVSDVHHTASKVEAAAGEIANGNHNLSQRTERQSSALQETAASMEQLSATVKQNADNAKQANQLALGASSVALDGGEVVGRVVETMQGITESSRKIADIITVIDGIAFQTNILALNAAVEAARAGEQGRGFAVVAGEVRTLAQRSAEAAKEIKALISASVERVEQGTTLVDQAGSTMHEVVAAIRRVTDIVGEITAASEEQSAGVSQVGQAVTQMDQATQQNAALVEQSASAAQGLREQAHHMVQAIAVFHLS